MRRLARATTPLITGGGTGIGAAIARALGAEGAKLTLVGRRREKLEEVGAGAFDALVAPADVTVARGGRPRLRPRPRGAGADHHPRQQCRRGGGGAVREGHARTLWRDMLAVNLDGMFHCCQAALPDLLAAPAGPDRHHRLDGGAPRLRLRVALYRRQARRGRPHPRPRRRICADAICAVNAVCPGFVDTDMTVQSVSNITAKTGRSEDGGAGGAGAAEPVGPPDLARGGRRGGA